MNDEKISTCGECKHWHTSERFMDKYGQGCGQCSLSFGDEYGITFCSHQCFMCERSKENENVK